MVLTLVYSCDFPKHFVLIFSGHLEEASHHYSMHIVYDHLDSLLSIIFFSVRKRISGEDLQHLCLVHIQTRKHPTFS